MSNGEQGLLGHLPQDAETRWQRHWGIGLAVLGFISEWMFVIVLPNGPMGTLGIIVAVCVCAGGIGYYSKAKGNSATWGVVGLVPFLGFLLFLFLFPLVAGFRKNWPGFVLSIIGWMAILFAIAIPGALNYGRAPISTQAKYNLARILVSATSYKTEQGTFAIPDIHLLGFTPMDKPIYTYWYAVDGVPMRLNVVDPDRARGCDGPPAAGKVATSATGFTAVARGNIDDDSTCDEWSVNDARDLTRTIDDIHY